MNNKNTLILVAGLMAMVFVAASVFAYYPLNITVSPTTPPVTFATGSNSNQDDLGPGNTITVSLGSNYASASVTVHPTYQTTYYMDVLRITNSDSKAYNVTIRVVEEISSFSIKLKIYTRGTSGSRTLIGTVDLTYTHDENIGILSSVGTWEVDIEVSIPEGSPLPSPATAKLQLIYTPSSETPP
jgi:hypothetical protein